jgi:hypothetical protein
MKYLLHLVKKTALGLWSQPISMLMLVVSLVLHGVLLALPMPPEAKPEPEEEKEEEVVKITSFVAASPSPASTPKSPPKPPQEESQPQPQSQPQPDFRPQPQVQLSRQINPDPNPTLDESPPQESVPEGSPSNEPPSNQPLSNQPPSNQPPPSLVGASAEEIEAFLALLRSKILESFAADPSAIGATGGAAEDIAELEDYLYSLPFEQLAVDSTPFGSGEQLNQGSLGSLALPRVNLTNAREKVEAVLNEVEFSQIEEFGEYGGAALLKAQNELGAELYVSLVKQKLGSGVFVVLWPQDPNLL